MKKRWAIYIAEETDGKRDSWIARLVAGEKNRHAFLMLVDETNKNIMRELHFSAFLADGRRQPPGKAYLMNVMAVVADQLGLLSIFRRVADKIGLGDSLVRIKGVQTSGRRKFGEVALQHRCFKGTSDYTMRLWNMACRQAIALNKTDTPFFIEGLIKPAINCRAGMEMVLESIGLKFNAAVFEDKSGIGRHLYQEFEGFRKIVPDKTHRSLPRRLRENVRLSTVLYRTRPQANLDC